VVLSFFAAEMNVQPPAYEEDAAVLASSFDENGLRFRTGHFVAGIAFALLLPLLGRVV